MDLIFAECALVFASKNLREEKNAPKDNGAHLQRSDNGLYVVGRTLFLQLLNCSTRLCLGFA